MFNEFVHSLSQEQKDALLKALTETPESSSDPVKTQPDRPRRVTTGRTEITEDFTMRKNNEKTPLSESSRVPVTAYKRTNEFVDDGTEAKGDDFKTPDITPTERRRPAVKKVQQTCSSCGKTVEIHPSFARDWYTCDNCISSRVG